LKSRNIRKAATPSQLRVVFDTNTVISALLFSRGSLSWLRQHWQNSKCVPLISREAAAELKRVLSYPKFRLTPEDQLELLSDYIPHCEIIPVLTPRPILCRDPKYQTFLDLAQSGKAHLLVTGDQDLTVLAGQTAFVIETPAEYHQRFPSSHQGT